MNLTLQSCASVSTEKPRGSISALARFAACLAVLFSATSANAHSLGESYLFLSVTEESLSGRFEALMDDLAKVLEVDADGDGEFTDEDVAVVGDKIAAYLTERTRIIVAGKEYPIQITEISTRHLPAFGRYALVSFDVPDLTAVPDEIEVEYQFLFDEVEPDHRGMLVLENNTRTNTKDNERIVNSIFDSHRTRQTISFLPIPAWKVLLTFIKEGIWHIWIGLDHILFIIALLLPAVLVWRPDEQKWYPIDEFKQAMWNVVKVITLFTIAHSITLSLASLKIFTFPSAIVETIIALSIAVTALNNIRPFYVEKSWVVVVLFGLFHGFGFASVLEPLGLMTSNLVLALFGFNVGVELGQVVIIAVVFPILYALRKQSWYQPVILKLGSFILVVISAYWCWERGLQIVEKLQERGWL